MRLGAVPLLAQAEGAILRQVHPAMGATHHQCRTGFAGALLFSRRAFELAPEPHRGSNNGNPEQKTKHDEQFLDEECASLARTWQAHRAIMLAHKKGSLKGLPFYVVSTDQSNTPKVM